jgi:large subunit ribosomal protein L4
MATVKAKKNIKAKKEDGKSLPVSNAKEQVIYNQKGKEVGKIALPLNVFGIPWNADLVHQVVTSMQSNARSPIAHTKGRGEVRGGGRKPWKQKGTGRARHGSIRSPLWAGGGVTHGPKKDENYSKGITKSMKMKALYAVLSRKSKDRELVLIDSLSLSNPKTKEAKEVLTTLAGAGAKSLRGIGKGRASAYIALAEKSDVVERAFRNIGNVFLGETRNLNPVSLLNFKYIILVNPESSFAFLAGKSVRKK